MMEHSVGLGDKAEGAREEEKARKRELELENFILQGL